MLYVLVFILGTANSPSTSNSVPNLEQNVCNNLKTDINMRMSGKVLYSSCVSQGTQNIIILSREQQQKELDTLMNEAGKK